MRFIILIILMATAEITWAQNSSPGTFYALRLKPHDDLKNELLRFTKEHQLKAAAIVSCVGSLEEVSLRYANESKATTRKGFFEIVSLVGTVSASSSHLHLSVSDSKGATIGGHVVEGSRIYTTVEIVLVELTDLEFLRETDSTYGYQELVIKKRQ
jgi:uncharacterized protein